MTIQVANNWLLNEFSKFYLRDNLNLIIDSINKESFIDKLSNFVNENKTYAEDQIRKNNPDQADILINELSSLNYVDLQVTYALFYDQIDPIPKIVLEPNPEGTLYTSWLNSEMNILFQHAMTIFNGGLDPLSQTYNIEKEFVMKSMNEMRSSLDKIENIINGLVK